MKIKLNNGGSPSRRASPLVDDKGALPSRLRGDLDQRYLVVQDVTQCLRDGGVTFSVGDGITSIQGLFRNRDFFPVEIAIGLGRRAYSRFQSIAFSTLPRVSC